MRKLQPPTEHLVVDLGRLSLRIPSNDNDASIHSMLHMHAKQYRESSARPRHCQLLPIRGTRGLQHQRFVLFPILYTLL